MAVFDENVREILSYTGAISDAELKHDVLVALVKDKAKYRGVDLFERFYTQPYANGNPNGEKDACNYMVLIPLLQKLYDAALAHGKENSVRFGTKPGIDEIEKIKRKIEAF